MTEKQENNAFIDGLSQQQVEESRQRYGNNLLTPPKRTSIWKLYLEKYKDPIIQILLVAAVFSLVLAFIENDFVETIGIFIAIFLATTIGFIFEQDAAKKFDVLTSINEEQSVKVRRNGRVVEIPRKDVVVGDIVLIETGDEIPADGTLLRAVNLQVDESSLTGEPIADKRCNANATETNTSVNATTRNSSSVNTTTAKKNIDTIEADQQSTYPADMVLRSTMVMNGNGTFRVTAVGDETEIGKVARHSTESTGVKTPLNIQLDRLAKIISKFGIILSVAAFVIFLAHDIMVKPLWHTTDYFKMAEVVLQYFMMALTLIVMAVPEGLPMAITLSLALNMRRMLKSNNLVRKLHACETMGAVTVICTDKTGTLTENRMRVAAMQRLGGTDELLQVAAALNTTAYLDTATDDRSADCVDKEHNTGNVDKGYNKSIDKNVDNDVKGIGNPTEVALLLWLKDEGCNYATLRHDNETIYQLPFSTERKYMATVANVDGKTYIFVKGAPEIVEQGCIITEQDKTTIDITLHGWQNKAMRTLAFGYKELPNDITLEEAMEEATTPNGLTIQAIAAINDPIRKDVPNAVAECRSAGIEVKIVTGDTAATAREIARQVGTYTTAGDTTTDTISGPDFAALTDDEAAERARSLKVMYRARPTDKQRLVKLLQEEGQVVAVTGDGTNDAPALNHAHVGLSLGSSTSVAKEASDMTLLDDSFGSIVNAVVWGRSLYKNIQRFLFFQLTVNVAALLLVLAGSLIGTDMPLTVTQILWVNLIMDTFAAMALASLPPTVDVMKEKPRRQTDFIITPTILRHILGIGISMFVALLIYLIHCLQNDGDIQLHELSMFFTTFVMLQLWNMLNAKALGSKHSAFHGLTKDRGLLLVMLMIIGGQWLIVTFGGKMFRTVPLTLMEWVEIVAATSVVLWAGELWRLISRRKHKE